MREHGHRTFNFERSATKLPTIEATTIRQPTQPIYFFVQARGKTTNDLQLYRQDQQL